MAKEKILIAVKTYPTISEKYNELACTAGFREDGSWIRLYPIPFRLLTKDKRYKKYQWIEADISKNKADPRPESYRVLNNEIQLLNKVGTEREWEERRKLILGNNKIYTNLKEIISHAHSNTLSLVIFKPTSILDFVAEDSEKPEWPTKKINTVLNALRQGDFFEDQNFEEFKIMPKLPK